MADQRKWASSAQVYRENWDAEALWKWNATGFEGEIVSGSARSEEEAWRLARQAQGQLEQGPIRPKGMG